MKYPIAFLVIFFYTSVLLGQHLDARIQQLEQDQSAYQSKILELDSMLEVLRLEKIRSDMQNIGLPKQNPDVKHELIGHGAIYISYNEDHEQANWVEHIIVPAVNVGNLPRTNDFRIDSLVKSGTAVKADYWYSGYDRGHLAPSADFRWSKRAISESYMYSNMSPQKPELNREIWANLESFLRKHVWVNNEQLYVVTGPVLESGLDQITQGPNKLSIPKKFFKVIMDLEGEEIKGIGFIMPNEKCEKDIIDYAYTIDEIENLTGIDFFPGLDKMSAQKIESTFDFGKWEILKEGEVPTQVPLSVTQRPKNTINSADARIFVDKKACVCGTVVSTRKTNSGSVFFNLDKKFPNHIFSGSIWENDIKNFSFDPEIALLGKKICMTGTITLYKDKPTMNIAHERKIDFIEDQSKEMH